MKDIRIGDYQKFTRIVFELNAPVDPGSYDLTVSDRLTVVFKDTTADFIRKIPVDRSPHVKDIQIWSKHNQLSAIIKFDFKHFRHESFQLKHPPRVVLDIQPLPGVGESAVASVPVNHDGSGNPSDQVAPDDGTGVSSRPNAQEDSLSAENANQPVAEATDHAGVSADAPNDEIAVAPSAGTSIVQENIGAEEDQTSPLGARSQMQAKKPNRLQFYLVIVLVLITIAILVLLLLMLLSRHHWADDRTRLKPTEFLKNQDKHLASLDARIKEQLKRYEEA